MTSFMIIELAALVAPIGALVLVPWLGPERRRRLLAWSVLWLVVFAAGAGLGLRLTPAPLGAAALAVAAASGWVIVFALRPEPSRRVARSLYWLMIGAAFLSNYLVATMGVLGIGLAAEGAEPEVRERLATTVVAYAFYRGGATLDFSGYEVQVRRRLPWVGFLERVTQERRYITTEATRVPPPSFRIEGEPGARTVVVTLGDWVGDAYASPDTIRLD